MKRRTFIQPDDRLRQRGVALKYNPLPDLEGKRIILVDDSIVRGNTSGPIVALLRQAGELADQLVARFPDCEIVGYDEFGNTHGGVR